MTEENDQEGRAYVEMNEEQQARFNRIYGHMKEYESIASQAQQDLKTAFTRIEELEKGSQRTALDGLRSQEKEHLEAGELDKAAEIRDQITDMKVEAVAKPKEEPKPEPSSNEIPKPSWMTPDVEREIVNWASETDSDGNYVRPWANPSHPDFAKMGKAAELAMAGGDFRSASEILGEVDRVMGAKPRAKRDNATVLSGDGDPPKKSGKLPALTDSQKAVAARMDVSEERYAKMVGASNGAAVTAE